MSRLEKTPVVTVDDRVIYSLQPKQFEAYSLLPLQIADGDPYPQHIGYGGAGGGGKSYWSRAVLAAVALLWPGSTAILFRRTEREVKENHINNFRTEFPDFINGHRWYSYNGQDLALTWENGSRTLFGYLRHDDDVYTYQGPQYDVMIFEESTHYSEFMIRWLTGNRLRATVPGTHPFALYPSNPGNRGHIWYKRLFVDKRYRLEDGERPEDYAFVQAKLVDNQELVNRDPGYAARLDRLPEPWRSWQRDGDWTKGVGVAFHEIDHKVHLVSPFPVPDHWVQFGSFDWGYEHPWSFGHWAADEDGKLYKIQTITGRRMLPHEIAERIARKVPVDRLSSIHAGHDCWARRKALGENVPTVAETFAAYHLFLTQANIDRVQGLQQLRLRLHVDEQTGDAGMCFLEEEGNKRALTCLEERISDPNDPEDILKTDADEWGEGGDDLYDETRYGVCSRPLSAPSLISTGRVSAFSKEALLAEVEATRRRRPDRRAESELHGLEDEQMGEMI